MVALGSDVDVGADDRTAVGGVEAARVAGGRVDCHVIGIDRAGVGREDAVGALACGTEAGVGHDRLGTLAHGEQDRVQAVEVAVVAVGIVSRLGEGAVGDGEGAAVLGEGRVLVGLRGVGRLTVGGDLFPIGSQGTAVGAGVVEGHRVGPTAAGLAALGHVGRRSVAGCVAIAGGTAGSLAVRHRRGRTLGVARTGGRIGGRASLRRGGRGCSRCRVGREGAGHRSDGEYERARHHGDAGLAQGILQIACDGLVHVFPSRRYPLSRCVGWEAESLAAQAPSLGVVIPQGKDVQALVGQYPWHGRNI